MTLFSRPKGPLESLIYKLLCLSILTVIHSTKYKQLRCKVGSDPPILCTL